MSVSFYRVEDGIAVLTIDSPPVNALGQKVRVALSEGVTQALSDDASCALVLICAGRTFFAGADVTELGKPILPPLLADVMAQFEASTKPIVSAMHGTALGGGLEMALAGHYRVAVPSAVVGLPEVALGLIPGAGGTQRVPRLVGVVAAIDMIGLGRHLKAADALAIGLIDAIVPEGELEAQAILFAQDLLRSGAPLRRLRDQAPDLDPEAARAAFTRFRAANPELFIGVKAADGALRALEAAVSLPFDEGLERERAISRELVATPESAAQRRLFFAERAAAKLPGAEKAKAGTGTIEAVETEGDFAAYRAAIGASDAETIIAMRFVERLGELAAAARRALAVVGMMVSNGVAEIVVGPQTAPEAALAAMALARKQGFAAIFVTSGHRLVIARLRDAISASILSLEADGVAPGDIGATGRAFGFADGLLPAGDGTAREAIERRMLRPILAEARAIVAEGLVMRASDVDFAAVRAGLWPLWRSGPAFMAERDDADGTADSLAPVSA